jgi:hypothetical protein
VTYIIKNSFRGGIISESLSARVDFEKYNESCRELKNFILQPQGGVYRRPGLRFIAEPAADGTPSGAAVQPTLVPLIYNSETSYIIALLEKIYKVYVSQAYLDEGETPFTAEQSKTADYAQSADTLYLCHKNADPFKILRLSTSQFEDTTLGFDTNYPSPATPTIVFSGTTASTTIEYAITANTDSGEESLPTFGSATNGQSPLAWSDGSKCVLTWVAPGSQFGSNIARAVAVYEVTPRLVLVGDSNTGSRSSDGISWVLTGDMQFGTTSIRGVDVDSSGPVWVAVGILGKGSRSTDGDAWSSISDMKFGSSDIFAVKANSTTSIWVAVGLFGKASRSINNGVSWAAVTTGLSNNILCIAVNETANRFVIGGTGTEGAYSDNGGSTWTTITDIKIYAAKGMVYSSSQSLFVAVGVESDNTTKIVYSTAGVTWAVSSDFSELEPNGLNDVTYSPSLDLFVAVGNDGIIGFSDDADIWSKADRNGGNGTDFYTVAWSDTLDLFVAGGEDGRLETSSDGIIWTSDDVPDSYSIYKKDQGVYGYIGTVRGEYTFTDYNYTPVITDSVPEEYNPFSGQNPGVVALFQQRLWFASTPSNSQTVYASRVGDFENMNFSPFIRPDDSIQNTISSSRPDGIQWLVPFNKVVKVGTVERVWTMTSSSGGPITPTDINIEPVLDWGAAKVRPVLAGNSLIYVENKGSKLFDLFERQEYLGDTGNNLSVNASHLFEGYEIVSMAYQRTPDPIIWCVRDDGKVVAMTYLKNESLWAWHLHETDGLFKNVVVIPGTVYDEVYFTVYRNSKYLIEMLEDKWDGNDIEEAKFLDSMVTQTNVTPFTLVTGLAHLNGKSVYALADGLVEGPFTVSGGQITLSTSVNTAHVGLLYTSVVSPLSVEFATQNQGASLGKIKSIEDITLRLKNSQGGKIGPRLDYLDDIETTDYSTATNYSGDVKGIFQARFNQDASFYISQDQPLPMTLLALFIEVNMGEK